MWGRGGGRLSVANNFCSIFLLLYIFIAFKTRGLSKPNTSSARPRLKRKMMRRAKIVHIPCINDCVSSPGAGVEAGSVAAKQVNKCNSQFRQFSWAIQTNWVKRCPPASAIRKQTKKPNNVSNKSLGWEQWKWLILLSHFHPGCYWWCVHFMSANNERIKKSNQIDFFLVSCGHINWAIKTTTEDLLT